MVLDGHTSGGDVNKYVSHSDFRPPNILPKNTFKAKADIENWFYITPYFFFSAFPPTDCPYLPLLHVFTTAWDPCFWHGRASWLLNKHDHVEQSLVLPELLQFVNVKGMKNSEWYKKW